mgnify:CR=1 FL=1
MAVVSLSPSALLLAEGIISRVSIAKSETVPEGSTIEFEIICLDPALEDAVVECLDYGALRGLSQWRNSGKGRFTWEKIG